jgi:hypothetical protein
MLLAQAETVLETAKEVAGLPTSVLLALCLGAVTWKLLRTEDKLEKANAEADAQRDFRLSDLKETMGLLNGDKAKESHS